MSLLLSAQSLTKSHGTRTLFAGVQISVSDGQRIGLIGPNGSGKSTLLRILTGLETPDDGRIERRGGAAICYLPQEDVFAPGLSVREVVLEAIAAQHQATGRHVELHQQETTAAITLSSAGFVDLDQPADTLSGGWRKRLAIAREVARQPDLLLLDEPTNHLDVEGIAWLEQLLAGASFASVIVSHDRWLLENVATQVVELNRAYPKGSFGVDGAYSTFLEKREEFLAAQQARQASLESVLRREVEWLRRGAKARTTKAKGRIEAAGQLMTELSDLKVRNSQTRTAQIDFVASNRQTRKLIALKHVAKSLGGRELFRDVSFILSPGVRLGLVGPNGSGKTTLIRLLRGDLQPDAGTIERADGLRLVVFDQSRQQLDRALPLRRALSTNADVVEYRGSSMHISSWARRFLFRPEQLDLPVGELSGGEQSRVLVARLMLQPDDVLVLDEPTNDLDIATLEVLEESLADFPGALVLVTHDRYMLQRLSTDLLGLDGFGDAGLYAGLGQWQRARDAALQARRARPTSAARPEARAKPAPPPGIKRLTYMEQREWEQIESRIAAAEAEVESAKREMEDPRVMADHKRLTDVCRKMEAAQHEVNRLYHRYEQLEARQQADPQP